MLAITIPGIELWDEVNQEFTTTESFVLELEHSLVSLSKWESIYEKPFLGSDSKSDEEIFGYIKAMILTPVFPPEVLSRMNQENMDAIRTYIDAKMTATWFNEVSTSAKKNTETITAELIYYWMISLNIPMECENWHLNRLFTLIKIFNIKNTKPQKMTAAQIAARNRELNAQRKAQLGTTG